jgi:hypothetical protein
MARNDGMTTDPATGLVTESVSENYEDNRGQMDTRHFFIAYPPHVVAYGHEEDRITRKWGSGKSRSEALAHAKEYIAESGAIIS